MNVEIRSADLVVVRLPSFPGFPMFMAGQRVLVVEDDSSMREAIERLLGAAGIEAKLYPTAEELLANGAAATAACIVSDWRLPALSGLEMLDAIHARGWQPPLILITAHDAPGMKEEAVRRGAAAYLAKPFRGTELIDTIRDVVSRPGETSHPS